MNSTTTSNDILRIRDLNVAFKLRQYQPRSLREVFVKCVRSPLVLLKQSPECLQVLKGVNLDVRKGDRLALIGVNGGGKTTLCRCIAGILHPASGSIELRGATCRAIFNAQVGVTPGLTGRENARLLARFVFPKDPTSQIESIADEACHFSELGEFLDSPYETYSQGMKSRLCLSVITARSSDLLLLDEVYDNTDVFFQEKMQRRLRTFIDSAGAVIFVSHAPDYIRNICNRAVVLHHGKIAYDGDVERALHTYDSLNR